MLRCRKIKKRPRGGAEKMNKNENQQKELNLRVLDKVLEFYSKSFSAENFWKTMSQLGLSEEYLNSLHRSGEEIGEMVAKSLDNSYYTVRNKIKKDLSNTTFNF
jgi:hypothetical protein